MNHNDTELSLMEFIYQAELGMSPLTQRDLAHKSGMSLGMTNSLLRRLAERGWVKLTKLSPRSVRYALTPEGIGEILRRTESYFRRAARNAGLYRGRLEEYILALNRRGVTTLILSGSSEVDFILEYLCDRHALVFVKCDDPERTLALGRRAGVALMVSEQSEGDGSLPGAASLARILANEAGTESPAVEESLPKEPPA